MYGKPLLLFDNMLTEGVVTATTTAAGDYALANLYDLRPYTWWLADGAAEYNVFVENAADRAADYIYIAGDTFINATINVISFDAGWTNPVTELTVVIDGKNDYFAPFASSTRRNWQVQVYISVHNALTHLMLGNKLELPRYLQRGFDPLGSKPRGRLTKSSKGHPLGTAASWREWQQKIMFRNIDAAWLRSSWQPAFDGHLKHSPSVFVWDPVEHSTETYLVHPVYDYDAPHRPGQFADLSFTLEGLAK